VRREFVLVIADQRWMRLKKSEFKCKALASTSKKSLINFFDVLHLERRTANKAQYVHTLVLASSQLYRQGNYYASPYTELPQRGGTFTVSNISLIGGGEGAITMLMLGVGICDRRYGYGTSSKDPSKRQHAFRDGERQQHDESRRRPSNSVPCSVPRGQPDVRVDRWNTHAVLMALSVPRADGETACERVNYD
jgi:hypothetical protein